MNEEANRIFLEVQKGVIDTEKYLNELNIELNNKIKQHKVSQILHQELSSCKDDTKTYKSVGKSFMFIKKKDLQADLEKRIDELSTTMDGLSKNKKVLEKKLESASATLKDFIHYNK